jgi:hypothetical protein
MTEAAREAIVLQMSHATSRPGTSPTQSRGSAGAFRHANFAPILFWFSEKIVGKCSIFVLAIDDRTNIVAAVPLR